jgi:hypothetical protein
MPHNGKIYEVQNGIQWEMAMCLGRRVEGKEVQLNFCQFVSVFMVQTMGVSDHFTGFPDDAGIVTVDQLLLNTGSLMRHTWHFQIF